MRTFIVALLMLVLCFSSAQAFGIKPVATENGTVIREFELPWYLRVVHTESSELATDKFGTSAHERITHMIYGCTESEPGQCGEPNEDQITAPAAVIAGSEWNDNPPFRLKKTRNPLCKGTADTTIKLPYFPGCWYLLFRDGGKRASNGEVFDANSDNVILYRSHYGDLQFLHSMGTQDGEKASFTRDRIMMWLEYTYRFSIGEFDRSTELRKIPVPGMADVFKNKGWGTQELFTLGDVTFRGDQDLRDFAFGSFLHLIQDSFSRSHTARAEETGAKCQNLNLLKPGQVTQFLTYASQDSGKHKKEDSHEALTIHLRSHSPNVVDVGKAIKSMRDRQASWDELKGYLLCVFDLQNPDSESGPGEGFEK